MAYGSFEEGGITVSSSEHSDDQLAANLTPIVDDTTVVQEEPSEPAAPVEATIEDKPKPRNDPKARMLEATAKEAAAKRERDEAKAESAKLQARIAELEARSTPKPAPRVEAAAGVAPEPKEEDFQDYRQFVKAQARWEAEDLLRQREEARQKQEAQQRREHYVHETERTFGERYAAAKADDPSFETRVMPKLLNTLPIHRLPEGVEPTFDNYLVTKAFHATQPKAMLLHVSDPAVYQRYATLPPLQVERELAIFEHELGAASPAGPAPTVPAISHAKPPIKPVGTSPLVTDANEITDDLSVDEHIRRMNARDRGARRAS